MVRVLLFLLLLLLLLSLSQQGGAVQGSPTIVEPSRYRSDGSYNPWASTREGQASARDGRSDDDDDDTSKYEDCPPSSYDQDITLLWYAPFYSNSGYGSEATEIVKGFDKITFNRSCTTDGKQEGERMQGDLLSRRVTKAFGVNHGDGADTAAIQGWSSRRRDLVDRATVDSYTARLMLEKFQGQGAFRGKKANTRRWAPVPRDRETGMATVKTVDPVVVVCHSEPGAWNLPKPNFDTTPCPPVTSRAEVPQYAGGTDEEGFDEEFNRLLNRYYEDEEGVSLEDLEDEIVEEESGSVSQAEVEKKLNARLIQFRPKIVIGRTMFETDRLPLGWRDRLLRLDEVWVPTEFHKTIFSSKENGKEFGGIPRRKLFVLPEAIDAQHEWNPDLAEPVVNVSIPREFQTTKKGGKMIEKQVFFDFTKAIVRFKPSSFIIEDTSVSEAQQDLGRQALGTTLLKKRTDKIAARAKHAASFAMKNSGNGRMSEEAARQIEADEQRKAEEQRQQAKLRLQSFFEDRCRFKFLSVFKWEDRKGWDVLLPAFYEEFTGWKRKNQDTIEHGSDDEDEEEEPICLVLKTSGYHSDIDDGDDSEYEAKVMSFLHKTYGKAWNARNDPKILLLSAHIPQHEYAALYKSVDALVQPSRGEGWGRPPQEAMAMGLPVIATNWSGPTAFIQHEVNGFLISLNTTVTVPEEELTKQWPSDSVQGKQQLLKKVEAKKNAQGLRRIPSGAFKGHYWAEPSISSLRQLMRSIAQEKLELIRSVGKVDPLSGKKMETLESLFDPSPLGKITKKARQDMLENFSPEKVASMATDRVEMLVKMAEEKEKQT